MSSQRNVFTRPLGAKNPNSAFQATNQESIGRNQLLEGGRRVVFIDETRVE